MPAPCQWDPSNVHTQTTCYFLFFFTHHCVGILIFTTFINKKNTCGWQLSQMQTVGIWGRCHPDEMQLSSSLKKKLFSFISKIISIHTSMLSLTSSTLRSCTWWLSVESFYFRGRYLSTSCRWIFERGEVFAAELLLALRLFDQRALLLPMGESWEIFSGKKLKLEHIKCNIKLSFFVKSPIHSTDFNCPARCGGKKRRTHWFDLNSQQSHHRTHFNNIVEIIIITSMTTTNNWPSLSW